MTIISSHKNNRLDSTAHHLLFAIVICLNFWSCKTGKQVRQFSYDEAKAKAREVSLLAFDFNIPFAELEHLLDTHLPKLVLADTSHQNATIHYKVMRIGKPTVWNESGHMHIKMPLQVIIKPGKLVEKWGLQPSAISEIVAEIEPRAQIDLHPDSHWQVHVDIKPRGFEWKKKPVIKVAFLQVDLSDYIDPIYTAHEKEIYALIEKKVSKNWSIKHVIDHTWKMMQAPIALTDESNSWLTFSPTHISAQQPKVSQQAIIWPLQITGNIDAYLGEKPIVKPIVLPDLSIVDTLVKGVELTLVSHLLVSEADKHFLYPWIGKKIPYDNDTKSITIDQIDLKTIPDKIQAIVHTSGDHRSVIKLSGKPAYDPNTTSIYIEALDIDIDSTDKQYRWVKPFVEQKLKTMLKEKLRFSLHDRFAGMKNGVKTQFFQQELLHNVLIEWQLQDSKLAQTYITPQHIIVVLKFTGKLQFTLVKK